MKTKNKIKKLLENNNTIQNLHIGWDNALEINISDFNKSVQKLNWKSVLLFSLWTYKEFSFTKTKTFGLQNCGLWLD
jgi:hypothetical protein